jgi:Na+/H+-dicarboxylate symporter
VHETQNCRVHSPDTRRSALARTPLAARVLVGLILGFAIGLLVPPPLIAKSRVLLIAEPVGALFVNLIRMTVIPLVVASLIVAVATAPDPREVGAIGIRALVLFLIVLFAGALLAALVTPAVLALSPLDASAVATLRASASTSGAAIAEGARAIPTAGQWVVDLVPANVFKAASDGAILPLIVFALALGVALGRIGGEKRRPVVAFFDGVADAMLVLIRWIIALAPIGVLALAIPLAARVGTAAVGALAIYIAVAVGLMVAFNLLVLYPLAVIGGGVGAARFARASFPAQAVAFGSRSSLASLGPMIEATRDRLALPPAITTFFLPLAVATFRAGAAVNQTVGVIFVAYLYGSALSASQLATIVATVVVTTFSVPAIPGGSILVMVPVLLAAGLPVEGVGVLLAVDTIPDMFRTTTNVTGHLTVATLLGRRRAEVADTIAVPIGE